MSFSELQTICDDENDSHGAGHPNPDSADLKTVPLGIGSIAHEVLLSVFGSVFSSEIDV